MRGWISWGCGDKRYRVGDTKSRGRVSIPDWPLSAAHNLKAPGFAGGWL